jgi:hypothetical protein
MKTCQRAICGHPATEHSALAGCLSTAGTGYCACPALLTGPERAPATTERGEAFPTPGGTTFVQEIDGHRLNAQQAAVYSLMRDGRFRTLREIEDLTGFPQASISARLRDLRKAPLNRDVQRRRRESQGGTWEYAVLAPEV